MKKVTNPQALERATLKKDNKEKKFAEWDWNPPNAMNLMKKDDNDIVFTTFK